MCGATIGGLFIPMTKIDFVRIPSGRFMMGVTHGLYPEDGEGPQREVALDSFEVSATAISNATFSAFISASGYITTAELLGGSMVFSGQLQDPNRYAVPSKQTPWWRWVPGACWRRPDGHATEAPELPAVHISYLDAIAFCEWAGARLPTEAEWECAASDQAGITPHIWQGHFPDAPATPPAPKPVQDATPNGNGLYHACGNVWEWTADKFTCLHSPRAARNPKGPLNGKLRVVKGGSFLCAPSYCARFRPSSRRGERPEATAGHTGFRVVSSFT